MTEPARKRGRPLGTPGLTKPDAIRNERVTGIRFTAYGRDLLLELTATMGTSQRAVLEEAMRLLKRSMAP